jgi:glucose-1-phosphate thymidylyltransferase
MIMQGVILAGGTGSRLHPCTKVTNKHLLPVYNRPMIYYPLKTLMDAGVKDILIVTGPEYAGDFLRLLGSGREFGVRIAYELQDEAGGIAQALSLAENFIKEDKFMVILGDNIIEDSVRNEFKDFLKSGQEARIFLKEVPDAQRFGVAEINGNAISGIEEKPKNPKSNYAVIGLYMYSRGVFDIIKKLKPSKRNEYEITEVNNRFINKGTMGFSILKGFWSDAGTFQSLYRASGMIKEKEGGLA